MITMVLTGATREETYQMQNMFLRSSGHSSFRLQKESYQLHKFFFCDQEVIVHSTFRNKHNHGFLDAVWTVLHYQISFRAKTKYSLDSLDSLESKI